MIIHASTSNFKKLVEERDLCLVDFYATWCGPCQLLGRELEEIGDNKNFDIIKVDVDDCMPVAMQYNINAVPTMMFFKKGMLKRVLQGYMSAKEILNVAEKID